MCHQRTFDGPPHGVLSSESILNLKTTVFLRVTSEDSCTNSGPNHRRVQIVFLYLARMMTLGISYIKDPAMKERL